MLAPQSDDEIRPIVDELRLLDARLDVRWNPTKIVTQPGRYTELGKLIPPKYDGRWEVILYDSPDRGHAGFHPERGYTVLGTITEYDRQGGVLCWVSGGAYAPIDARLLEVMRSADAQNVEQYRKVRERLWAAHDQTDVDADKLDEGMAREGLDRNHFAANYAGGVGNWQGHGADFAAMEAKSTKAAVGRIIPARR
ncbi:MAG: hypothetical protein JWM41_2905 [Gemmatimonadetes bacterium]|nr:hypothetical protein [Gemmatimonadota bacterium]